MKVEHLREFIVLANTLNFSISAKRLQISQPVLSTHIKQMEAELGVDLFHRDNRHIRLSKAGQTVFEHAEALIRQYDAMLGDIDKLVSCSAKSLSVGYLYHAVKNNLPGAYQKFSNEHQGVSVSLRSLDLLTLLQEVPRGGIDVALLLDVDEILHDVCNFRTLYKDPICCVVRVDDPLASCESVSLFDLRTESFILPDPTRFGAHAQFYRNLFAQAGCAPNVASYYREIDTRHLEVLAGSGIALIGSHFQRLMSDQLKFIPVTDEFCHYNVSAAWKKSSTNPLIEDFVACLEASFAHDRSLS